MDSVTPFQTNWIYLRTELNWLDRVLATAIARQQKDVKDVQRVARSRADQVTSHWWKGLITLEGTVASDSPADFPRRTGGAGNYQQQMEARIRASQQKGIILGVPSLCQALDLSTFEKNLLLMALAPEVSRRYGKIYNFLQETDYPTASGLPTVDLILRLLCRNDEEWRTARSAFAQDSKLVQHGVIQLPDSRSQPFLSHPVKLANSFVEFLLATTPEVTALERLIRPNADFESPAPSFSPAVETWNPKPVVLPLSTSPPACSQTDLWEKLILPEAVLVKLRHLCHRVQYAEQVDDLWGFGAMEPTTSVLPGTLALLVGASGTGKTMVASAIAHTLQAPLVSIDLDLLSPEEHHSLLQTLAIQSPTVLLLKSAQVWLGRSSPLPTETIRKFLAERQSTRSLTLLSVERQSLVQATWQKAFHHILEFPLPTESMRLKLWQQAFPVNLPLEDINWSAWSRVALSGGTIRAIAREAAIHAAAESPEAKVGTHHLIQACETLHIPLKNLSHLRQLGNS